jgi:ferredoxin-type protein NapH
MTITSLEHPPAARAPAPHGDARESGSRAVLHKLSIGACTCGFVVLALAFFGVPLASSGGGSGWLAIAGSLGTIAAGAIGIFWTQYAHTTPGIKHDGVMTGSATRRGAVAWALGLAFTLFYVVLYFYEALQARGMPPVLAGGIRLVDPLSRALSGHDADKWFLYGTFYTLAVLVMGVRMLLKYRHSRYQQVRTASVMFFQLGFSFLIPPLLKLMQAPEFYFTYFWPLKSWYGYPDGAHYLGTAGKLGVAMLVWATAMTLLATPVLTYFYGKRWYCSFVCGCGALAETAGDPWRQNSDKSLRAWKIERWMVHSVLVLVVLVTATLWFNSWKKGEFLGEWSSPFAQAYGLVIGSIFSGVVGVGFYPLMGARVWCRFGCPMAAVLGLFQRFFSRFRITTNGGQCISCGNCSTYCEMGIDVRAYAQRGENIIRASCVGCGVCSAVCPRGVLNLENGSTHADRFAGADKPVQAFLESVGIRERYGVR